MKKQLFFLKSFLLTCCIFGVFYAQAQRWELSSPDKKVKAAVWQKDGQLQYAVTLNKAAMLEPSPLGIIRDDGQFSKNLAFVSKKASKIDESYSLKVGKSLQCRNLANQLMLSFQNEKGQPVELIVRCYNDGVAYRYNFSNADNKIHKITKEESGFALSKSAKGWIQPYDLNSRKKPCYEAFYENGISPGASSPNPAGWAFPALFKLNDQWMLITEAGLDETYAATHLEDKASNGVYTIRFPEKEEVTSDADPEPVSTLPWATPWRAIIVGKSLGDIQESHLVTNLNAPSILKDDSWVRGGKSSWSWWSAGATTRDFDVQKAYIDFTADMKWDYVLIDAGWPEMKNGSMPDLVRYANSKGVGIVLWYHSGMGREKDTLSYANLMAFPDARRKEFAKIAEWGVKGVKVDFFDSDKQPVIKRYFDILRDAADYKVLVNCHGSTLPRGWERTYPHLVSMESVKGAEGAGRQEFCDRAPVHNTILPYTRNAVGPMDYTPVTFTNKREAKRQTTFAHELALSIVFESGVFHYADNMKSYQGLPTEQKNFLRQVPAVWDETKFIDGIPGKYSVVARRKGDQWYVAGINGQDGEQVLTINLPFMSESGFKLVTDGQSPGTFASANAQIDHHKLKVTIAPKGGFVLYVPTVENTGGSN